MKSAVDRRLYPTLHDASYIVLSDQRRAIARAVAGARGTILDYGAGNKPYRPLFPPEVHYIGADFVRTDPWDVVVTDPTRLDFPSQGADWVVSFQVLEHVASPEIYLAECWRVLRTGGTLLLSTHGAWPYHPGESNGDYQRWTREGLSRVISAAGFTVETVAMISPGTRSILQQMLVLRDPHRHVRSRMRRGVKMIFNTMVNLTACLFDRVLHGYNERCDILPINYLVTARRDTNPLDSA